MIINQIELNSKISLILRSNRQIIGTFVRLDKDKEVLWIHEDRLSHMESYESSGFTYGYNGQVIFWSYFCDPDLGI